MNQENKMSKEATTEYEGKVICSAKEYHSAAAVGSSSLRTLIDQSPAHYWWNRNNLSKSTPTQEFGTAIHQAILEPKRFKEMAIVEPTFSGTGSRALRDQWHLQNHGKTIVDQDQFDTIQGILESISAHKQASKLVADGHAEESLFWRDPESGVQCKARPDFIREGRIIVDIKSTADASYRSFQKDVANYGYHVQAALYLDGASVVLNGNFDTFIIVAVEKKPPYAINCFQLDENTIQEGRQLYASALKTLRICQDSGKYPAFPEQLVPIALPSWAVKGDL